jgi:hypothetical protein
MTSVLPRRAAAPASRPFIGVVLVASFGLLVVWLARWGPDWPAQEFRAWSAAHEGLAAMTTRWYSGLPMPGYSLLYPPLARVLGAGGVGLASCVLACWGASGIVPGTSRRRTVAFDVAVAVSALESLLIGQVPFLLGAAFGVWALRMVLHDRDRLPAGVLALLASLSSPLAGGFLLLALPSVVAGRGVRRAVPLTAAAGGLVVAAVVGGAGGPFPCPWVALFAVAVFCVAMLVWAPPENRAMRYFALCYLACAVLAFVLPNPVGGNITRLGKVLAIPLACLYLPVRPPRIRVPAGLVAALAIAWPTVPFITSATDGAADPSRSAQYYAGLLGYLRHNAGPGSRVEIPFTREHWEAYFVAQDIPIARGWERQSDLQYNAALYRPLTAQAYRRWLDDNAVDYVALPDVALDSGGEPEAALLRHAPAYLVPAWHDAHWQVWRVRDPAAMVTGPASLVSLHTSVVELRFTAAGRAVVHIRGNDLWQTRTSGTCLSANADGWLVVASSRPQAVTVTSALNGDMVVPDGACRP